jgi:hypothetical protein
MSQTVNRLSDYNGLYVVSNTTFRTLPLSGYSSSVNNYSSSVTWTSVNATQTIVSTEIARLSRYAIRLAPDTDADISLLLASTNLFVSDNGNRFSFNALVKPEATVTISASLQVNGAAAVTPFSQTLFGGRYNAIRSNNVEIPDDGVAHSLSLRINISNHESQNVHFTAPNLINDQKYYENTFVSQARRYMPDFYFDLDITQENPVAPFHKFIDALSHVAGLSYDKYVEIFPFDSSEIPSASDSLLRVTHSTLVEPLYADPEYLTWLAQFMGTNIKRNIIKDDGSKLLPSFEVENNYSRWQVDTGYHGIAAGSREAVIESVKKALIFTDDNTDSTYSVALTPRFGGDPFTIRIQTLINETPDVTVNGESSPTILSVVEDARPLGYKIVHTAVTEYFFTLGDSTIGLLGGFPLSPPSSASTITLNYPGWPTPPA